MTVVFSTSAQVANEELQRRSSKLTAYSFSDNVSTILLEDGSEFKVTSSFTEVWESPDGDRWLFLFCEHYPAMFFDEDDVLRYSTESRYDKDGN